MTDNGRSLSPATIKEMIDRRAQLIRELTQLEGELLAVGAIRRPAVVSRRSVERGERPLSDRSKIL